MKLIRTILILFGLLIALIFLRSCSSLPVPISEEEAQPQEKPQRTVVAIKEVKDDPQEEPGNEGQFIAVSADYRQYLGFPGYVRHMKQLGGRFVLFNTTRQQIVAEVDPEKGTFSSIRKELFQGMSPRTREVQKEIAVTRMLRKADEVYGAGRYTVLLLLPQRLDDRMQVALASELKATGINPGKVVKVSGIYRDRNGLEMGVHTVQMDDGRMVKCSFILKL